MVVWKMIVEVNGKSYESGELENSEEEYKKLILSATRGNPIEMEVDNKTIVFNRTVLQNAVITFVILEEDANAHA